VSRHNRDVSVRYFRVNTPSVVHERFDEDVVAIHLEIGNYHSTSGTGADVFLLLADGASAEELTGALAAKYAATPDEIAKSLSPFLEELENAQLIVPTEAPTERTPLQIEGNQHRVPFAPPSLEVFKDLEGLLLLDPIHEVGEEGWPPPSPPRA
jgi:hypothetical protein